MLYVYQVLLIVLHTVYIIVTLLDSLFYSLRLQYVGYFIVNIYHWIPAINPPPGKEPPPLLLVSGKDLKISKYNRNPIILKGPPKNPPPTFGHRKGVVGGGFIAGTGWLIVHDYKITYKNTIKQSLHITTVIWLVLA